MVLFQNTRNNSIKMFLSADLRYLLMHILAVGTKNANSWKKLSITGHFNN